MTGPGRAQRRETYSYLIGYAGALATTFAAFGAVYWRLMPAGATLATVFALAFLQMLIHFRCFLHIGLQKSSRDDLQLILFSGLIITLMVSGTVVILLNLRVRMM